MPRLIISIVAVAALAVALHACKPLKEEPAHQLQAGQPRMKLERIEAEGSGTTRFAIVTDRVTGKQWLYAENTKVMSIALTPLLDEQ